MKIYRLRRSSRARTVAVVGIVAAVVLAAIVIVALVRRGGEPGGPPQTVGALTLVVGNRPDPPAVGDNVLTVAVRDAAGSPVRDAAIDVVVSMPAMGAMPYMESRGRAREARPGVYRVRYGIRMAGDWDLTIRVAALRGPAVEAIYRLSTRMRGLAFVSASAAQAAAGAASPGAPGATGTTAPPPVGGAVTIDAARVQALGVRTAPVEVRSLSVTIRATGRVAYSERQQAEVALKYGGFVRDVRADFTGRPVRAGEVLFTAYSPELWSAQREYLEALRAARTEPPGSPAAELAQAARRRLELWDVPPPVLRAIMRSGRPREALPVIAPSSGVVVEKAVVEGSAFTAGQVLYKIAPLDPVWVVASVYQMDLPLVRLGMRALLRDPYSDEVPRTGRVSFVEPSLESDTRTARVRIEVPNPGGALKAGMYLDVVLEADLGARLAIPESAVLPTGERRIVFVAQGGGRFAPREIQLGRRAGEWYEVLAGLAAGENVVISGNFLIAAESRLRSATEKY